MNVAVVHYHLNRGGVTRVIANQLEALESTYSEKGSVRVAILFGGRCEGWPRGLSQRLHAVDVQLREVPALEYDQPGAERSKDLVAQLQGELRSLEFDAADTVIHVHNHNLGKNAALPKAICELANRDYAFLLQIHDFAEDFRPENYRYLCEALETRDPGDILYPSMGRIHYATLNRRDTNTLRHAGIDERRLHFLPNPVAAEYELPDQRSSRAKLQAALQLPDDRAFYLYPVRGIGRKNLGEVLLWAACHRDKSLFGVTQPPLNPSERHLYQQWKKLSAELNLPCRFEVGQIDTLTFEELLSAADAILTTSVAEGFGMVFLESWLAGRPLVGRDLPEITPDFVDAGIVFENLYERLEIPVDWVGSDHFVSDLYETYARTMESFGRVNHDHDLRDRIRHAKILDGCVDFGDLSQPLQAQAIRMICQANKLRDELLERNPVLARPISENRDLVRRNRRQIEETYGFQASGRRLATLYGKVLAEPAGSIGQVTGGQSILDTFLNVERFRMIRV